MTKIKPGPGINTAVEVILPCLDEAAALPQVLPRLPAGFRAIVVDNGSTDGSAEIAAGLGAVVVTESARGYGAAVHAGLLAARAEWVAIMDCDGSIDPHELTGFLDQLRADNLDLVCGRRRPAAAGVWPWHARIANRALAALLTGASPVRLHDIAPVRVARREALLALELSDRRSGYPLQTLLRARRAGWRIAERDIGYHARAAGTRSKVMGTVRGTATAGYDFARVLVTDNRGRA